MNHRLFVLPAFAAVLAAQVSHGPVFAKGFDSPVAALSVGRWNVEFANGVTEFCRIGDDGESSVEEPRRGSAGQAVVRGNSVVITFHDDRVERWTPVGRRFVVEHWFPGSRFPAEGAVLGIAEHAP